MPQLFKNNVSGVLASQLLAAGTSMALVDATNFPSPGSDHYLVTLIGLNGNGQESSWEIVKVTGKSGNTLTVVRAQESTSAATWPAATRVEMRLTAGSMESKQDALVSGTNIKTVNGNSLLGSGNLAVGDVTQTGAQTLTNKTWGAGTTLSATLGGGDNLVQRVMLQDTGWDFHDSGATNALDFVNGSCQRWAPNTGAQTLTIANWPPTGNLGELLIEGVNLGAATITWPTINWVKSDGTTTTSFASNGVTLRTSGVDWVLLWTRDAGTTIYGKVVR